MMFRAQAGFDITCGARLTKIGVVFVGLFAVVAAAAGLNMAINDRIGAWRLLIATIAMFIFISAHWLQRGKPGDFSSQARQSFPQPVVLVASRSRNLSVGIASVCLLSAFVDFTRLGDAGAGYMVYCLLFSAIFGIPGSLLIAASFKPNRLLFGRQTLAIKILLGSKEWSWEDVSNFRAITNITRGKRKVHIKRYIGFSDRSANQTKIGIKLSHIAGSNASLSNEYPISEDELASVLNEWQARVVAH